MISALHGGRAPCCLCCEQHAPTDPKPVIASQDDMQCCVCKHVMGSGPAPAAAALCAWARAWARPRVGNEPHRLQQFLLVFVAQSVL